MLALLAELLRGCKSVTYVCDKRFLIILMFCDYAVKACCYERGFNFYEDGQNYGMVSLLAKAGSTLLGKSEFDALLAVFQRAVKEKTSGALDALVVAARKTEWQKLPEVIGPLAKYAAPECLEAIATEGVTTDAVQVVAAEIYSQRFYIRRHDNDLHLFILPLFYAGAFGFFTTIALAVAKRDPTAHKRFILLGTTVIAGAACARWWGTALTNRFGDQYWGMIINTFAGTNLLLAIAVGYDIWTRGRPHRTFVISVPLILISELLCSWVYHAEWWMPVARRLIQIPLPLST